ncbi:tRNA (N(6)-L-threonylcarbamoyladenosine(37)-C(2))-methylthiotransferase MtaB [Lachnospiraceae bacterium ZAX-1]
MKKAALHNLGCKVNAYETDAMQQLLEQNGYEIVPFGACADVYVINTCSVTNIADRKSRQMLHRARKRNPDSIVVAAGCYVQTAEAQIREDEAIDILIGNDKKHELVALLEEFEHHSLQKRHETFHSLQEGSALKESGNQAGEGNQAGGSHKRVDSRILDRNAKQEYEEMQIDRTAVNTRAFIKVQDGCNQFCSYCIIPLARGRVRSRKREDIIAEVGRLAQNGYKEVVLAGIHLSSYGVDLNDSLLNLLKEIHAVEGIKRIRLSSLEPQIVTEEFVRTIATLPKICPHFHLSLQSGCDETLKRMNRKYDCGEYKKGCELLRKYFKHPAITTDIIVGFPGETQEEFETTRKFLKEIAFFEVHIFKYSRRKGTKAAQMEHQVAQNIKNCRSSQLFEDTKIMKQEFLSWYQNKETEVLFEERVLFEGNSYCSGHTREYVKALVVSEEHLDNKIMKSKVKTYGNSHIFLMEDALEENID